MGAMPKGVARDAGPVGSERDQPSVARGFVLSGRRRGSSPEVMAALSAVLGAGESAREALDQVIHVLTRVQAVVDDSSGRSGVLDQLMASDMRQLRQRSNTLTTDFAHAMMVLRGVCIRELVDERKMSLSEVARELSISRQMVTRLYGALRPSDVQAVRYRQSA